MKFLYANVLYHATVADDGVIPATWGLLDSSGTTLLSPSDALWLTDTEEVPQLVFHHSPLSIAPEPIDQTDSSVTYLVANYKHWTITYQWWCPGKDRFLRSTYFRHLVFESYPEVTDELLYVSAAYTPSELSPIKTKGRDTLECVADEEAKASGDESEDIVGESKPSISVRYIISERLNVNLSEMLKMKKSLERKLEEEMKKESENKLEKKSKKELKEELKNMLIKKSEKKLKPEKLEDDSEMMLMKQSQKMVKWNLEIADESEDVLVKKSVNSKKGISKELKKKFKYRSEFLIAISIGVQLFQHLAKLANLNIVYDKMAPASIAFRSPMDNWEILLTDFGNASFKKSVNEIGGSSVTSCGPYKSVWKSIGATHSFRDDAFGVLLVMGYMMYGRDFAKVQANWCDHEDYEKYLKFKREDIFLDLAVEGSDSKSYNFQINSVLPPALKLRHSLQVRRIMSTIITNIRALHFDQVPDYERFVGLLRQILDAHHAMDKLSGHANIQPVQGRG